MITATIKRPDGQIETVDLTAKFSDFMSAQIFAQIKGNTAAAGRGEVQEIKYTAKKTNLMALMRAYNNLYNEGADGFMPDASYFTSHPKFKEWEETKVFA